MTSKEGVKGRLWETACVESARERRLDVARVRLSGTKDIGDLCGCRVALECKNQKTMNLAGWIDEANAEAARSGKPFGVVLAKRRGKTKADDGYAIMEIRHLWDLLIAASYAETQEWQPESKP